MKNLITELKNSIDLCNEKLLTKMTPAQKADWMRLLNHLLAKLKKFESTPSI
jgi:hypothetical protein